MNKTQRKRITEAKKLIASALEIIATARMAEQGSYDDLPENIREASG